MNGKKIHVLFFLALLLLMISSCKEKERPIKRENNEEANQCFSPSDAIYKFAELNRKMLSDRIMDFFVNNHLPLDINEKQEIIQWVSNRILNTKDTTNKVIKEWNLDDEDFCSVRNTTIMNPKNKVIDSESIKVCNSILNEDVSLGNDWYLSLKQKKATLSVVYCSKIVKTIKRVGYYEILEKNDKLEYALKNYRLKHTVETDIYLYYENESDTIRKKIITTPAFLYSDLHNFSETDYKK